MINLKKSSLLIILSGPSGVGKDAVITRMKELGRPFHYAITATTRPKRSEEKSGVSYYFLEEREFQQKVKAKQFLEWAKVYDNYYGVPKDQVNEALKAGKDVLLKVDVQGAATIKKLLPTAIAIFLLPPSQEELIKRLRQRYSEDATQFALRTKIAKREIKSLPLFDYAIVNHHNGLDKVIAQIDAIVTAEKCKVRLK